MNDPVYILRIDPDGTVTRVAGTDVLAAARDAFGDDTDVNTLSSSGPAKKLHDPDKGIVPIGVIHDWGIREGLALNEKAWALYGRSPIYGPMFVTLDTTDADVDIDWGKTGRPPLPAGFVALMESGIDWVGPELRARMADFLRTDGGN